MRLRSDRVSSRPATTPVPRSAPACHTSAAPACEAAGRRSLVLRRSAPLAAGVGRRGRARGSPPTAVPTRRRRRARARRSSTVPLRRSSRSASAGSWPPRSPPGRRRCRELLARQAVGGHLAGHRRVEERVVEHALAALRRVPAHRCSRTSPRGASARRCGRRRPSRPAAQPVVGGGAGGGGGNGGAGAMAAAVAVAAAAATEATAAAVVAATAWAAATGPLRAGPPRTHRPFHAECATRRARSCRRKRGSIVLAVQN